MPGWNPPAPGGFYFHFTPREPGNGEPESPSCLDAPVGLIPPGHPRRSSEQQVQGGHFEPFHCRLTVLADR
jgi:hypothetical protein